MSYRVVIPALLVSLNTATCAFAGSAKINVTSPAFEEGGQIPAQFTCKGENVNPPLRLDGIPAEAKTLAMVVEDPDAPGGLFTHWLVWNMPASTRRVQENTVTPGATQGGNDFGHVAYGGPCPPSGTHRYYFRVLALDSSIDLPSGAKRAAFDKAIAGHVIARGELMGRAAH